MSHWDTSNANAGGPDGMDRAGQANDVQTKRRKSHWEKRMEAARAQRARVLSGEIPATPRPVPPARELAKGNGTNRNLAVGSRLPERLVMPVSGQLPTISSARAMLADWLANVTSAAANLTPDTSRVYDRLKSRLAHVSTWGLPDSIRHKRTAGIVLACGCSLAVGYVIGTRSDGDDDLQPLAIEAVTETPLSVAEEVRRPIIVGRLVEPEPDVIMLEVTSQSQAPAAQEPAVVDARETRMEDVAVWPAGLTEAQPVAPEVPDILSELSSIAWTSKIIVEPETLPNLRSAVVSPPPAAPEVPPGASPDEVVRLAGLPAQTGSLRMLVFAPDSVRGSVLEENLARLTSSGAEISRLQRVGMRISTAHIRYFYEEDAQAAMNLGDTLGVEARSFLHMSGSEPGQVEVWLRGAALSAQADPEPEPDGPQSFRDRFSGDYR